MTPIGPAKLEPIFLSKVWGGRSLQDDLSIRLPENQKIGEAWLLYDRAEKSSKITGTTTTIADWMKHDSLSLLGPHCPPTPSGAFPLLLKYLDCAEKLSVQCHPDDDAAAAFDDLGKTEAWVVVGARPGGSLTYGFQPNVTKSDVIEALNTPAIEPLLKRYTPQVGDAILVPAGVVHSPGAGLTLFEVQTNSNLTFRLYDWGRDRELHLQQGASTLRVTHQNPILSPSPSTNGGDSLVSCNLFCVRRLSLTDIPCTVSTNERFLIVNPISGAISITWQNHGNEATFVVRSGETAIIPACTKQVTLHPIGGATLLLTQPGKEQNQT